MAPYVRTVKTSSGATAVQIVHSNRRGSRDIEHIGSAYSDAEVEVLKITARQRLAAGKAVATAWASGLVTTPSTTGRPATVRLPV